MIEVKIYKSRWKAITLIFLVLPFVAGGIFMLTIADANKMMAWLCIGFFGLGIPLGIFNLLDKRPVIELNETGIFQRTAYKDVINWGLIRDSYIKRVQRQPFLCLLLDKNAVGLLNVSKFSMQFSKDLGLGELNIPLSQISKTDTRKLAALVKAMVTADAAEQKKMLMKANFVHI